MTSLETIYYLLQLGLNLKETSPIEIEENIFRKDIAWDKIYTLATQQGVIAIAYDGLELISKLPDFKKRIPKAIVLKWGMTTFQIEDTFKSQLRISSDLASIYDSKGMKTVVLKGLSVARYYPCPQHRPCCDFDCFLLGDYKRGNAVAIEEGATVDDGDYKHSHISFRDLMIENHQFLTDFNGTKYGKQVEKYLQGLLYSQKQFHSVDGTKILLPNINFTFLFLLQHAHNHFMTEGLTLRHLVDWCMFLKEEQDSLDWNLIEEGLNITRLLPFAEMITCWCMKHLGLKLTNKLLKGKCNSILFSNFEKDLISPLLLTNNMRWWEKIPCLLYRFKRTWGFRTLSTESIWLRFWNTFAYSSYWHRVPKL